LGRDIVVELVVGAIVGTVGTTWRGDVPSELILALARTVSPGAVALTEIEATNTAATAVSTITVRSDELLVSRFNQWERSSTGELSEYPLRSLNPGFLCHGLVPRAADSLAYRAREARICSAVLTKRMAEGRRSTGGPVADIAFEVLNVGVGPALDLVGGQLTEPAFHHFQPRSRRRRDVERWNGDGANSVGCRGLWVA
jgi:hypothetical protein